MPSKPEEDETGENCVNVPNVETVREITQTDHLNKKLLTSYLNSIKMSGTIKDKNGEDDDNQEEEQNWDS